MSGHSFFFFRERKGGEKEREREQEKKLAPVMRTKQRLTTSLDRSSVNCLAADSGFKFFPFVAAGNFLNPPLSEVNPLD